MLGAYLSFEKRKTFLETFPNISGEELLDQSKGDWMAKSISVCQILWTVLPIGVRLATGLGVSPLEVAVLAIAMCALILIYPYLLV